VLLVVERAVAVGVTQSVACHGALLRRSGGKRDE
jgi:hypothetical protein